MNIFLTGFMGSGKSTLGKQLAVELKYTFLETDTMLEHSENLTIHEIFEKKGEEYFRDLETQLLHRLKLVQNCVIATGGGTPCFNDNMDLINELGVSVWLDVEEKELVRRLENDQTLRPKLLQYASVEKAVLELLPIRKSYYQKSKIRVTHSKPDEVLVAIETLQRRNA